MGNELLYQLTTKDSDVTLRIEMRGDRTPSAPEPNAFWWNHYTKFKVGPEASNYMLQSLYIDWMHMEGNASTGWYDITACFSSRWCTILYHRQNQRPNIELRNEVPHGVGENLYLFQTVKKCNQAYTWRSNSTIARGMFWIINGFDYIIHPRETTMMLRPTQKLI
ncbi:hypothetical protein OSTOST_23033 [Ostertagia ostertagi]